MDGQAQEAPSTTEDIAQWLVDNPDADRNDEEGQEEQTDDSTQEDTEEAETEAESPDQDESEEEESDAQEDQPSDRKFKVTVKGEDGADLDLEVDEKELIAGYKRHSDYTRKTQELARREEQALDVVKAEVSKAQNYALQQSQLAQAVVLQLAGIRSPQEMAALAQSDPAAYVAEKSRMEQIQAAVGNLQAQAQQIQSQQSQQQSEAQKQAFRKCLDVIQSKGIDNEKLRRLFEETHAAHGVPMERMNGIQDPALILIMAEAAAYRELQKKTTEVKKKAAEAPRLPQKQSVPRQTERIKRQEDRLRSGKASRDDLAAFIARHSL